MDIFDRINQVKDVKVRGVLFQMLSQIDRIERALEIIVTKEQWRQIEYQETENT
jgi:hypothetical protein